MLNGILETGEKVGLNHLENYHVMALKLELLGMGCKMQGTFCLIKKAEKTKGRSRTQQLIPLRYPIRFSFTMSYGPQLHARSVVQRNESFM